MQEALLWKKAESFLFFHPSFSHLPKSMLKKIIAYTELLKLHRGQVLLSKGVYNQSYWLVLSGRLCEQGEKEDEKRYFSEGDFVGIEQLAQQSSSKHQIQASSDQALLLSFSLTHMRILLQKSSSVLKKLRPKRNSQGQLTAGLPEPLWHYLQQQRQLSSLSYRPAHYHCYASWQPLFFSLSVFLLLLLFVPRSFVFQFRYLFLFAGCFMCLFLLKMRYTCEATVSEQSLIITQNRWYRWSLQVQAYPLTAVKKLHVNNWFLLPFLPTIGNLSFVVGNQKLTLRGLASPQKLYQAISRQQKIHTVQSFEKIEVIPQEDSSLNSDLIMHRSHTLLVFISSLSMIFFVGVLSFIQQPAWRATILAIYLCVLLLYWYSRVRYVWKLNHDGFFCSDRFDKSRTAWKLLAINELKSASIRTSWLGLLLKYGDVHLLGEQRREKITKVALPHVVLERLEILKKELETID